MTETNLAKRSTPELRKMLKDINTAKEKWERVLAPAIKANGDTSLVVKNIDKTIMLHEKRAFEIMGVMESRDDKKRAAAKKKTARK